MKHFIFRSLSISLLALVGCDAYAPKFRSNAVYARRLEMRSADLSEAVDETNQALAFFFGSPESPLVPAVIGENSQFSGLISLSNLQRSAGPVKSDEDGTNRGLYRKHCSNCHGLSGDGAGPTSSLLNPYPRDFRVGVFKFKSTPNGTKPLRADLVRILKNGICGTAMPSFALEPQEDIEALVDYVIYLTIRGEVERAMYREAVEIGYGDFELEPEERLFADPARFESDALVFDGQKKMVESWIANAAVRWTKAKDNATQVISPSEALAIYSSDTMDDARLRESIARGKALFHGKVANCSVCHGKGGDGSAAANDYDDWTKEWTMRIGIDPRDPKKQETLGEFMALGAHKPRFIKPRNLTSGGFRGGGLPEDIYRRLIQGIDGTPMPRVNLVKEKSKVGLTTDDVWDVVNYVLSLSDEAASKTL